MGDCFDKAEYAKDQGLTTQGGGFQDVDMGDSDDDDIDDDPMGGLGGLGGNKGARIDFEDRKFAKFVGKGKMKRDRMFVFQPLAPTKGRKINEFGKGYCHETLMYLTKTCLLPRKKKTIESYKLGGGGKHN